jgi:hypothetical protein
MMKCEKCGDDLSPQEAREFAGKNLCDDCYLDAVAMPKTCDPWAVYSAKNSVSQEMVLTSEQQRILDHIKTRGPLTLEQICGELKLSEQEFRNNFATLRHMELARGFKRGEQVCFTLFDDPSE